MTVYFGEKLFIYTTEHTHQRLLAISCTPQFTVHIHSCPIKFGFILFVCFVSLYTINEKDSEYKPMRCMFSDFAAPPPHEIYFRFFNIHIRLTCILLVVCGYLKLHVWSKSPCAARDSIGLYMHCANKSFCTHSVTYA